MKERTLTAEREAIPEVIAFLDAELDALGCPRRAKMQIDIAADELYSNIANYAYAGEKGPVTVGIEPLQDPPAVRVIFRDRGLPFNPLESRDPDVTLPAAQRKIGGLGIFVVKKSMDEVRYEYRNGENILTIRKNLEDHG